jgi:hypothetical protein
MCLVQKQTFCATVRHMSVDLRISTMVMWLQNQNISISYALDGSMNFDGCHRLPTTSIMPSTGIARAVMDHGFMVMDTF